VNDRPDGVLLVGHGTRQRQGTEQFFRLTEVLAERVAPLPVEGCLLEFQHPTIAEGWQALVRRGATHIRVAPLLLFAAGHARQDIPQEIARCAQSTPAIRFSQSPPLSRCRPIVDLATRRILDAAGDCDFGTRCGLVLVGRGSHHPCAQADMRVLGQIVARRCGVASHAVAFYAMAQPRLPEVLDQMAMRPGIAEVVVQPHLLFQGRLFEAIERQVAEASQRHRSVRFRTGSYLGPVPEVADAIACRMDASSSAVAAE